MMDALYSQDQIFEQRERIARKEGEEKGIFALCKLVRDNFLTKTIAAKSLDMTLAEFEKSYKKFAMAGAAAI